MIPPQVQVLILACGNTLRSDDGVGPWLAEWAAQHFAVHPEIRVISCRQWSPELAEDIAQSKSVLFIDCSVDSLPGSIRLLTVEPAASTPALATHHLGAEELLALCKGLYNAQPSASMLLTVGAASTELGADFSEPVLSALPEACELLEKTVNLFLSGSKPGQKI